MIFLAAGETASWTITTDAGKDAHLIEVLTSSIWIGTRSGSSMDIDGVTAPDAGLLIERLDTTRPAGFAFVTHYGPWIKTSDASGLYPNRSGIDVDLNVHVNDLLRAHPQDGVKLVDVVVSYTDGSADVFTQDITIDRAAATAYAFFLQTEPYGGYLRYYDASPDAERVTVEYGGESVTRDIASTPDGLVWLDRSDQPLAARLLDAAGNESPDILIGTRSESFEAPDTALVPWAVPPFIDPIGTGFGNLLKAVERSLNLEPESAGELVSPTTSRGAYLDAVGRVFGVERWPDERDADLRVRVFAAIRRGKATAGGLAAILTDLFDVPVQVLDHNTDSTIARGTFEVYLFAEPRQGVTVAAEVIRTYRAAGFAPTLTLSFDADPTIAISPRWTGAHAHGLLTDEDQSLAGRVYRLDGTWQLDGSVPLHANLLTRISSHLDTGVYLTGASSPVGMDAMSAPISVNLDGLASTTTVDAAAAAARVVTFGGVPVTFGGVPVTFASQPVQNPAFLDRLVSTTHTAALVADVAAATLAELVSAATIGAADLGGAGLDGLVSNTNMNALQVAAPPIALNGLTSSSSLDAGTATGLELWLLDSFTEASDTPLESHTPFLSPGAAAWGTGIGGENAEMTVNATLDAIQLDGDASIETLLIWPDRLPHADAAVRATINFNGDAANPSDRVSLILRSEGAADNTSSLYGYGLRVNSDGSARLDRWDNGDDVYLDGVTAGTVPTAQDTVIELRVEGSTISAYADGSLLVSVTDDTYGGAGYFRLQVYDLTSTYVADIRIFASNDGTSPVDLHGLASAAAIAPLQIIETVDVRTQAGTDFAYARFSPTTSFFTGSAENVMYPLDTATMYTVNTVRWQLGIPSDATILSAQITLYEAQSTGVYTLNQDVFNVGFEQADNPGTLDSHAEADTRKENYGTTKAINMDGSYSQGDPIVIPLPVAMLQEIIDRPAWNSGQYAMAWFHNLTNGNDHIMQVYAHGTNPAGVTPRLEVEYAR